MGRKRGTPNTKTLGPDTPYVVYALIDPETYEPFYVGVSDHLYRRVSHHITEAIKYDGSGFTSSNIDKDAKIIAILASGSWPCVAVLEKTTLKNAADCERKWIRVLDSRGFNLTNKKVPGIKPHEMAMVYGVNIEMMALLSAAAAVLKDSGQNSLATTITDALATTCATFELGQFACAHGADEPVRKALELHEEITNAKAAASEARANDLYESRRREWEESEAEEASMKAQEQVA